MEAIISNKKWKTFIYIGRQGRAMCLQFNIGKGMASTNEELKFICSLNKYLLGPTMCPEQVMVLRIYQ